MQAARQVIRIGSCSRFLEQKVVLFGNTWLYCYFSVYVYVFLLVILILQKWQLIGVTDVEEPSSHL